MYNRKEIMSDREQERLKVEAKKPTIKDVAERANVSKSTVSYVLNNVDKVSEETRKRVLKAMEDLNYVPNATARNLARPDMKEEGFKRDVINDNFFYQEFVNSFLSSKVDKEPTEKKKSFLKTIEEMGYIPSVLLKQLSAQTKHTVAVVMNFEKDFKHTILEYNPFYQEFISGSEYAARMNQLTLEVININDIESGDIVIDEKKYMGLIVLGQINQFVSRKLMKISLPMILVDQYSSLSKYTLLASNDRKGTYESVKYLLETGHQKIAFVGGDLGISSVHEERFKGYQEALLDAGLDIYEEDVFFIDLTYEDGIILAERLVEETREFDAVLCISDIAAIGLLKGFIKNGKSIPEDLSIMGFDNISASRYCNPELTTVDQNIFLKAEEAIKLLLKANEGEKLEREYILPVSIVERESVRNRNK